ncbi:MAG: NAD(P)H-dependent oxidoreductase [Desulfitobacteriaceae bacterium]
MKTLIIVAHPDLTQSKVNKRLIEELEKNNVSINNLYKQYPDENIDVEREQKLLIEHQRIILQFPMYWFSSPSLLKKWQDVVLLFGWAYGPGGNKLNGKDLVIAISTGASQDEYTSGKFTINELLKPFEATSDFIGARFLTPYVFYGAEDASPQEINEGAKTYVQHILNPNLL